MEIIFNENKKIYSVSNHAKSRLCERGNYNLDEATEECLKLINDGILLLETEKFRYIKNGNFFFPCKKDFDENIYVITTVLLYDSMVENRFQQLIDIYA